MFLITKTLILTFYKTWLHLSAKPLQAILPCLFQLVLFSMQSAFENETGQVETMRGGFAWV
jgi:hypothetical protein